MVPAYWLNCWSERSELLVAIYLGLIFFNCLGLNVFTLNTGEEQVPESHCWVIERTILGDHRSDTITAKSFLRVSFSLSEGQIV